MRKIIYLFVALFAIGCSQSKEDKIKLAFKDYVKANFDDPSKFEEVVSIDSLDTISTRKFKDRGNEMFKIRKDFFEFCDSTDSIILMYFHDSRYLPKLRNISGLKDLFKDKIELHELYMDVLKKDLSFPQAEEDLEKILSLKDTIFYQQRLSYRIKTSEGLKLKTCYVYADTLFNNIQFKDSKIKAYDTSDVIKGLMEFDETYGPLFRLFELKLDNNREILSLLEGEFGKYD